MSGYLLRKDQALARAGDKTCSCGHRVGDHHLLKDVWNADTGTFERHPDYGAFSFHCDKTTCDCVVVAS